MRSKESILNIIQNNKGELSELGIQHIGLFGSYARGEQSNESDIDILIDLAPDQESFDNFMAICDFIENLFPNFRVEIVTKNGLSPYIGPIILKEVLYA